MNIVFMRFYNLIMSNRWLHALSERPYPCFAIILWLKFLEKFKREKIVPRKCVGIRMGIKTCVEISYPTNRLFPFPFLQSYNLQIARALQRQYAPSKWLPERHQVGFPTGGLR